MDRVFHAVADPTRRSILDRLRRSGPLSLKELAQPLPMSRQAVTKHLEVLHESGLVQIWRRGRERLHALDALQLREVDDWLKPYEDFWDSRLARLKRHLEEEK